jgi:hypothetical protein
MYGYLGGECEELSTPSFGREKLPGLARLLEEGNTDVAGEGDRDADQEDQYGNDELCHPGTPIV